MPKSQKSISLHHHRRIQKKYHFRSRLDNFFIINDVMKLNLFL